ncbi:MAG TPA: hypothetical protein VJK02_00980 [Anaerolineales bacterium]|nr:hypothetical protein [Anaerolineales bacterium]
MVIDGQTYAAAGLVGVNDETAARAAAVELATLAQARLPARFTVPAAGEIHFELNQPTAETTPESVRAEIASVECGPGLSLNIHIRITSESGILSYSIWSTWGGGGAIDRTFTEPLPTSVDEVVVHPHGLADPEARNHEVGLSVDSPTNLDPLYV